MASIRKCVDIHCKNCTYDPCISGSWRHQVENCTVTKCALWPIRPVTLEKTLATRKNRQETDATLDALVDGLEDEDEATEILK